VDREVQARPSGSSTSPFERGERVPIGLRVRGRYRIVSELGTGAFGTVCVAQDESTNHGVAIRLFPRALATASHATQAVLRMGRSIISASTSHPGLTRVIEFGEIENGRPFTIMELVEGRRLSEVLSDRKPLEIAAALRLALDLGGAVETLHNMGFIHSALSPRNVVVLEDGRVKLLDIELAGLRDARELQGLVHPEPAPEYLSPEQISKAPVNEKTDIYAFGAMAYELLCGLPPFHGGTRELILNKHLKESPVPIRKRRPDVPGSVERAVTLALYKQPEPRPLMGDVLNLLWTGAHGPAPRRNRNALVAGGAALAVGAVVAVVWGALALRAPVPTLPETPVAPAPPVARPAAPRAPGTPITESRPTAVVAPATPGGVTPSAPAAPAPSSERAPSSPAQSASAPGPRPALPSPPSLTTAPALVPADRAPVAERPPVSPAPGPSTSTSEVRPVPKPAPAAGLPAPPATSPTPATTPPPARVVAPPPAVQPTPPSPTTATPPPARVVAPPPVSQPPSPPTATAPSEARPTPPTVTPPAARAAAPPATPPPAQVERRPEPRTTQGPATAAPPRQSDSDDPRAVIDWLFNPGRGQ
jgi:serine/threonine protein kinase